MMRTLALLAFLLTGLTVFVPVSSAQSVPASVIDTSEVDLEDLSVDFDDSFNAIGNPYLSDSMRLNYQITLLEMMTARQAELLKISDSFKALGLPFNEPAPARGLCEQLPPNAPCLKHYPELYEPLVAARKAFYNDMVARANAEAGIVVPVSASDDPEAAERARKAREAQERAEAEARAKAAARAAAQERAARYQWNDITCLTGQCTGVIVRPAMPGYRATVRKGMRLADGTLVRDVHARGIEVIIDGDRIDLRPAPSGDSNIAEAPSLIPVGALTTGAPMPMPEASLAANAAVEAALAASSGFSIANAPATAAAPSAPASAGQAAAAASPGTTATPSGSAEASGVTTTIEPALGPSGLF